MEAAKRVGAMRMKIAWTMYGPRTVMLLGWVRMRVAKPMISTKGTVRCAGLRGRGGCTEAA